MAEQDVRMQRLLQQAYALACGVAQEVASRRVVILPATGGVQTFGRVEQAKQWLREYTYCGMYGRRCFAQGCACHNAGDE